MRARQPRPQPGSEIGLGYSTGRNAFHEADRIERIEFETGAVVRKEQAARYPGGTLVSVCERLAAGKPADIGRRQVGDVGIAIGFEIGRTSQRGLDCALVAYAVGAAPLGVPALSSS